MGVLVLLATDAHVPFVESYHENFSFDSCYNTCSFSIDEKFNVDFFNSTRPVFSKISRNRPKQVWLLCSIERITSPESF